MPRIPRWNASERTSKLFAWLDGSLDVADLAAFCGVSEDEVEEMIAPLVAAGVVSIGDTHQAPRRRESEPPPPPGSQREPLTDEEKRRIGETYARLAKIDHYALLGVEATAHARAIKNAYFARAKLFHPDRFFRKDVGALRPKIDAIFAAMSHALETLSDPELRAEYDAYLRHVLHTRIARRNAEALEAQQDWNAAVEAWARIVEQLPADAYVQHRWAYSLLRARKDFETATAAATRAIELDPTRAEYRVTAAALYLAAGRDRGAVTELEVAAELEQDRLDLAGLAAALAQRISLARSTPP